MKDRINKILHLLENVTKSSCCLLINFSDNNYSFIARSNDYVLDNPSLEKFFGDLVFHFSEELSKINDMTSFKKLLSEKMLKSFYLKSLLIENNSNYVLMCFSDREEAYGENTVEQIQLIQELLTDEVKNLFLNSEINSRITDIVQNADISMLITDNVGKKIYSNTRFKEIFGLIEGDSFIGKHQSFYDENGKELTADDFPFIEAVKNNKNITDRQLKWISNEGKEIWFSINSILIKRKDNTIEGAISYFEDITKLMEIKLRVNDNTQKVNSILYSTDPTGTNYFFISHAPQYLFGYTPNDFYKNRLFIIRKIYPEFLPLFKRFIRDLRKGSQLMIEYKIKDSDGNEKFVRHTGIPIVDNGKVIRIVGKISDITEEKLISSQLENTVQKYDLLVESADELIFTLNASGNLLMINESGANLIGYKVEELIGKNFLEIIGSKDKDTIKDELKAVFESNDTRAFTTAIANKNRGVTEFEIKAKSYFHNGSGSGIIAIGKTLSKKYSKFDEEEELRNKLKETREQLRTEREKAKTNINALEQLKLLKNDFISNISHELRTPLASIIGFAETISSDPDLTQEMAMEFNNIILEEGKRLSKLINEILDFSKFESGTKKLIKTEFNLTDLVNKLLFSYDNLLEEKELNVKFSHSEDEIKIYADRERINKALENILSNAVKFTEPGGQVSITANNFENEVEIVIADTGVGIHENDLPNLFQKFGKANRPGVQIPGAGFGLVTVQQIVEQHKGKIMIESELNKGTTLTLRLPKNLNTGG